LYITAQTAVGITSPADGTVFPAPASITVTASASVAPGSTIARVEFYQGQSLIGTATSAPYSVAWTNVASGTYALSALVVDNLGASTTSSTVTVKVNAAPSVSLTSPPSGANATAPAAIAIVADALDSDGTIARVAFYRNGVPITTLNAAPYSFTWTGVPAGSYVLTATATDDLGSSATSNAVTVIVGAGGAQTYFIETDHLNTPRVIEDASQNLVWSWDNTEPFGDAPPNDSPSGFGAFEFPLRFSGQYFDRETGLVYNVMRNYSAGIGRYFEGDPIGLLGGLNTYAYVAGRPLDFTDPYGLLNLNPADASRGGGGGGGLEGLIIPIGIGVRSLINNMNASSSSSSGSDQDPASNVIPFPQAKPQPVCKPDDDPCERERARLENNKVWVLSILKTRVQTPAWAILTYNNAARLLNRDINLHNALCPGYRVDRLPVTPLGPTGVD
jgi:RHS repeat-associated protein